MSIIENFLVNTNNFESIIRALIKENDVPAKITDSYFKSIGFQNPSDLLVIHLLKGLQILEEDGAITELFSELRNPNTTRMALAKGLVLGYEDLFKKNPEAHKMQAAELQEAFSEIFQGQKTDLILKYMTNTFNKLVSYAGSSNIEAALPNEAEEEDTVSALDIVQEVTEVHKNGSSTANGSSTVNGSPTASDSSTVDSNSVSNGTDLPPQKEDESDISFEELVGLSSSDTTVPEAPSEQLDSNSIHSNGSEKKDESSKTTDSEQNILDAAIREEEKDNVFEPEENKTPPGETMEENIFDDFFTHENGSAHSPDKNGKASAVPEDNSIVDADEKIQKALIKKADLLYKLDRHEDVLPILEKIITHFDRTGEPFLKEAVSRSVIRRAMILCKLQKYDQALPALDKVIAEFADSDNKEFYEQASVAMLYKVQVLETTNQLDQGLPLFNSIVERLGSSDNPKIKMQVNNIFLKRLDALLVNGRDDEVLVAADQLIERFKNSDESPKHLEETMFRKAEILEKMGKDEEALLAYSEFLDKFGNNVSDS